MCTTFIGSFISTFVLLAGFVIGLGAVTVIDLHGFLGRKSRYWTLATTRTHKVTKPLIWIGTLLVLLGLIAQSVCTGVDELARLQFLLVAVLVLNGCFLSFVVSPFLLTQEKAGKSDKILPAALQNKITVSFLVSFAGWWGLLATVAYRLIV